MNNKILILDAAQQIELLPRYRERPYPGGMVIFYGDLPFWKYYSLVHQTAISGAGIIAIGQKPAGEIEPDIGASFIVYFATDFSGEIIGRTIDELWSPAKFSREHFQDWLEVNPVNIRLEESEQKKYAELVAEARLKTFKETIVALLQMPAEDNCNIEELCESAEWLIHTLYILTLTQPEGSVRRGMLHVLQETIRQAKDEQTGEFIQKAQIQAARRYREYLSNYPGEFSDSQES